MLFRLPIYLRMKRGRELLLDAEEITELEPKLGRKNRSSVTDDKAWEAVMLYHHVDNYFRQSWSIDGDFD